MLFVVVVLVLAAGARAEHEASPLPNVPTPLLLRLEGVIAGSRRAAERKGFTEVSLAFAGSDACQWLGVTDARTTGVDQPLGCATRSRVRASGSRDSSNAARGPTSSARWTRAAGSGGRG